VSTDDYTAYVEGAWPRLFRTAYALTGDVAAADDLLQATLVKVYVHWRKVRRADAPDAYVRRIMVNQAASTWRSRGRRPEVLTPEPRPEAMAGPAFDRDLAEQDALWRVVQTLPPRQRAVVVLRYYEDLSEREISEVLGIAPGTVKSLASAAMAKLRERLAEPSNVTTAGGNG
jgi:RNA polymerase sigma-70 factor (sigma-E family)